MGEKATRLTALAWPAFTANPDWRHLVVSVRLAIAAIAALAIAYWLELPEPQWAILTVYLLPQTSAGAALAKGAFRLLGTILAAICALAIVKAFSQIPVLLVAAATAWIFVCYYGATLMKNFASYGFMLAGYTGLLVIFEGAAAPYGAWAVAVNRATEISIGIACATAATSMVMPIYAGGQLRGLLAKSLKELAAHAAAALKTELPLPAFMAQRRDLLAKIVKFDALRSYAVFERRETRADDVALRDAVEETLSVLAVARSLYLRLADFRTGDEAGKVDFARLDAALEATIATLEALAGGGVEAAKPGFSRSQLCLARRRMASLESEVEAMAGSLPLEPLADMLLIIRRTNKLLRGLSTLSIIADATFDTGRSRGRGSRRQAVRRPRPARVERHEALLQGIRVALAVLVLCAFWYATEWDQGIAGITGLALMSYQCVNTDDPGKLGWPYFRAVVAACFCAYAVMAYVYPWLEGFAMLAAFLFAVLVPLGLLISSPRYGKSAGTFTIYFVAAAATANVYDPDPLDFANFCSGLVFGMFVCLMAARFIPVTSAVSRRYVFRRTIAELLPEAATGTMRPRRVARAIIGLLSAVLPRLKLGAGTDDIFLRGMLASASSALELGLLRRAATDPDMPEAGREAIKAGLSRLAAFFAKLPTMGAGREAAFDEAEAEISRMSAALERLAPVAGSPPARCVLRAASSLRFLSDRLHLDQGFLKLALTD
ncbi:FUSC family protein [Ancylobacter sp. G4_0304]|uniref:FUSC family protein n=1 Tax=Ancylobacter sp. G4_0304 TaxID=3114289 RepID=UPI0039C7165B